MVQEESDKPTVIALREIAEGFVTVDILNREEEMDAEEELAEVMEAAEPSLEQALTAEVSPEATTGEPS